MSDISSSAAHGKVPSAMSRSFGPACSGALSSGLSSLRARAVWLSSAICVAATVNSPCWLNDSSACLVHMRHTGHG
jgi:hypothetical protein